MNDTRDIRRQFAALEAELRDGLTLDSVGEVLLGLVNAVPDILYRLDADSRIVFISDAVRSYGLEPADLVGTSFFDLIHPDDRERARHRVNERRTGERSTRSFGVRLHLGETDVAFELNESRGPRVEIDAEGVYSSGLPRSQDFLYTQGVARDVSGRRRVEESLETVRQEAARRLGQQAQQIRTVCHQLQVELEARERAEARSGWTQRIRDEIWRMDGPDDIAGLLQALADCLIDLGVEFYGIAINDVLDDERVRTYRHVRDGEWHPPDIRAKGAAMRSFLASAGPTLRGDLDVEDPWNERPFVRDRWGAAVRAIIDVPFEGGCLAINSLQPSPWSPDDIDVLAALAKALEESFHRLRDLRALQERSDEAERLAAERQVALDREVVIGRVRERILSMRSLRDAPQEAEWVQALRTLGVPADGVSLQFPGSLPGHYVTFNVGTATYSENVALSRDPWVSQAWESGQSIRVTCADMQHTRFAGAGDWSLVEVPLPGGGSFGVNRRDGADFDDDMIGAIEAFARNLAAGVQRLRDFERLEESEQRHRTLVETLPMGVLHATQEGRILYANAAACEIFGAASADLLRRGAASLYIESTERVDLLAHLQRDGQADFESPMRHADGHEILLRGRATLVDNRHTGRTEIHSYFEDITALRATERQRAQLEEQLRQSQKMEAVGQLTAGIAHNFNNMLQGISGNLQLALLDAEGDLKGMLQDADRVTHRAADMIRQMMVFTRQGLQTVTRHVRLGPVVLNTVDICRRTFDRRIDIEVDLAAAEAAVSGDPGLLQQVLLNLLLNARDAVAEVDHPSIRLVVDRDGEGVCITVADNGSGMDEATRHRIFEPFFTTKPVDRGTGLGLATVYGIVTQYGGDVTCESSPGQGATFRVLLPVAEGPAEAAAEAVSQTATVLVVDDEDVVRSTTSRFLERQGYRVLCADSGVEALQLLDESATTPLSRIDLVLLDLSMPGLSGHDVLRQVRRQYPEIKVLIFTGYATDDDEVDGADGVVHKPITASELSARLAEVLGR